MMNNKSNERIFLGFRTMRVGDHFEYRPYKLNRNIKNSYCTNGSTSVLVLVSILVLVLVLSQITLRPALLSR